MSFDPSPFNVQLDLEFPSCAAVDDGIVVLAVESMDAMQSVLTVDEGIVVLAIVSVDAVR
jgi:hypothetical protein